MLAANGTSRAVIGLPSVTPLFKIPVGTPAALIQFPEAEARRHASSPFRFRLTAHALPHRPRGGEARNHKTALPAGEAAARVPGDRCPPKVAR